MPNSNYLNIIIKSATNSKAQELYFVKAYAFSDSLLLDKIAIEILKINFYEYY